MNPPGPTEEERTPGETFLLHTVLSPPPTLSVFPRTLPFPTSTPSDPTSTTPPAAPCRLTYPTSLPASVSSSSCSSPAWSKPVRFSSRTILIWFSWRLRTARNNLKTTQTTRTRQCLSTLRRLLLGVLLAPAPAGPRPLAINSASLCSPCSSLHVERRLLAYSSSGLLLRDPLIPFFISPNKHAVGPV